MPDLLLGRKYGHRLHFWDMKTRKNIQTIDLGDEHQMALELRPAHDPTQKTASSGSWSPTATRRDPVRAGGAGHELAYVRRGSTSTAVRPSAAITRS